MNNSLIYLATPTASTIPSEGALPLTTIIRRRGQSVQQANNSVLLGSPGYYHVSVNTTFTAPATGVVTHTVRVDGVAVQGATASETISTATTETRSISFDAIVRVPCCASPVTLTVTNDGVDITSSNISLAVEYLG